MSAQDPKAENPTKQKKIEELELQIRDLQEQLSQKDNEILRYRHELLNANQAIEKLIEQVGREVKIASQIQRLMSPTQIPNIPGVDISTKFIPGARLGGDYFDIFEHADKLKFGVLLSCSSGHAMSALFLSVLFKMTSQMEARKGLAPDQMVEKLARELLPQMSEKDRTHFFYGVLDRRNYELSFTLLGQIFGVIQEHQSKTLHQLDPFLAEGLSSSFVLSPTASAIPCMKITLKPKDRLILCTEGLLNCKNPEGVSWGKKGLQEALLSIPTPIGSVGVHEVRNNILFKCEQFTGQQIPERDQTILVIEAKENVLKLA